MRLGEITDKKLSEIKQYKNNTKNHPPEQINQIANSIQEFGFADPILINENNVIIAGHGRYEASKKLKLKSVPTITIYDLTEEQEKALRIAHNKLTVNSGFDTDKLKIEVESLLKTGFNLSLTGFDDDEFANIMGKLSPPPLEIEDDDDEYEDNEIIDNRTNNSQTKPNNNYSENYDDFDDDEEIPQSEVRLVQLYLNDENRQELLDKLRELNDFYGTDNPSDCVLFTVRDCHERYCVKK